MYNFLYAIVIAHKDSYSLKIKYSNTRDNDFTNSNARSERNLLYKGTKYKNKTYIHTGKKHNLL